MGFRSYIKHLGPALVLATVVLGPGSLALSTIAGSRYGYQLLWVPVIATVFMLLYTWMSARIGLVTGQTLFQLTRQKYGRVVAILGGISGFLTTIAFQAGNTAAVGFSMNALFGGDVRLWSSLFVLFALILIFLPDLYGKIELLVKVIVGLMILTFFGTLLLVGVETDQAVMGLVPRFPDTEAVFLSLGMAATTFSIAAAVYQGYLMREKGWGIEQLSIEGRESFIGITILGLISLVILLTSAGSLYGSADAVFSAEGMARQLEPLAGPAAFYLFTVGFFLAAISSMIVNPLIGSTLLVDGFAGETKMDSKIIKACSAVAMAAGLSVVLIFRESPIEILRVAQACAVVAFPVLGFLVLSLARDRQVMGIYANRLRVHLVALLGYLTILGMVIHYIRQLVV